MQVLRLVPSVTQQAMDYIWVIRELIWLKKKSVDSTVNTSHPFHLVVPKEKKTKKQQLETSKGFKVSVSSC